MTGRATVLVGVLIALLLGYAYPVRVYLTQQAEIAALEQQQAEQRKDIDNLAEQLAKWDDPEYVKSQARSRLLFVMPGQVSYVVLDAPGEGSGTPTESKRDSGDPPAPWYGKLWSSIEGADRSK